VVKSSLTDDVLKVLFDLPGIEPVSGENVSYEPENHGALLLSKVGIEIGVSYHRAPEGKEWTKTGQQVSVTRDPDVMVKKKIQRFTIWPRYGFAIFERKEDEVDGERRDIVGGIAPRAATPVEKYEILSMEPDIARMEIAMDLAESLVKGFQSGPPVNAPFFDLRHFLKAQDSFGIRIEHAHKALAVSDNIPDLSPVQGF
jgi:hypothetical protein